MISSPTPPPSSNAPQSLHEGNGLRARFRRFAAAWLLGAAVVVWPAWPTAAQERAARRPAFERALSWRDFIRMRLSPWLLMQDFHQHDEAGQHPHFVCVDCGGVTCLHDVEMPKTAQKSWTKVGKVTEILLKGHCNTCATH